MAVLRIAPVSSVNHLSGDLMGATSCLLGRMRSAVLDHFNCTCKCVSAFACAELCLGKYSALTQDAMPMSSSERASTQDAMPITSSERARSTALKVP